MPTLFRRLAVLLAAVAALLFTAGGPPPRTRPCSPPTRPRGRCWRPRPAR
ncbi:hypothetical protein ACFQZC_19850 [Streptacidiphilus monticola]